MGTGYRHEVAQDKWGNIQPKREPSAEVRSNLNRSASFAYGIGVHAPDPEGIVRLADEMPDPQELLDALQPGEVVLTISERVDLVAQIHDAHDGFPSSSGDDPDDDDDDGEETEFSPQDQKQFPPKKIS